MELNELPRHYFLTKHFGSFRKASGSLPKPAWTGSNVLLPENPLSTWQGTLNALALNEFCGDLPILLDVQSTKLSG
jgi:hypothetical protein